MAMRMFRRLLPLAFCAAAAACAPATGFQGISFTAPDVAPEVRALAQRASGGDRHALLELGIRFEEGNGVPVDWGRAERLYSMAAATTGGTTMVYVPPVRPGSSGRVMPMSSGPVIHGLPAARERLRTLRKRIETGGRPRRI